MKTALVLGLTAAAVFMPLATATHAGGGCTPTRADPSTTIVVDTPDGRRFYWEERDNPLGTNPPVPLSGFILNGGTWLYEEDNGINAPEGSMQRGGIGLFGVCLPPDPLPCLIIDEDPINDVNCGHGPDIIIV